MTDIVARLKRKGRHFNDPAPSFMTDPLCAEAVAEIKRLRAERDALRKDAERLNWLERWITDNSGGFEIYPIGPDEEYEADGSIVGVKSWTLADRQWPVKTMREAIDAAMKMESDGDDSLAG